MPSLGRDSITSLFPIWMLFIFFPCQTTLTLSSSTMLKSNGESKHPVLVANLRGKFFSLSQLNMMLTVGFHKCLLSSQGSSFVFLVLWAFLSWKSIRIVKCFFCVKTIIFLLLYLSVWYITLVNFSMFNQPYSQGINLLWSLCILFLFSCIWFASTLLRVFACGFINYWSVIFLSFNILSIKVL